jgi:hypothetical protein
MVQAKENQSGKCGNKGKKLLKSHIAFPLWELQFARSFNCLK